MPNFPALSPGSRVFSPGEYQQAAFASLDGRRTNVAHSTAMFNSRLELIFTALSETELGLIFQHYNGQLGSFQSFQVPAAILAGFPEITTGTGAGASFPDHRWRYSSPPEVTEVASDVNVVRYDVSVTLESTPALGSVASGAALRVRFTLAAGAATAASSASGAALTVTMTLAAGAVVANSAANGASLTLTLSLEAGAATGD